VQAATAPPPVDESQLPDNQKSLTEVNKELSNPISSIWALQLQENTFFIHPGIEDKSSRNSVNVQFQPVLPRASRFSWPVECLSSCRTVDPYSSAETKRFRGGIVMRSEVLL
jgi:hypothetical protein